MRSDEYEKSGKNKPLIVVMVGGDRSRAALQHLNSLNIPAFLGRI